VDYSFEKSLWLATAGKAPKSTPFENGSKVDFAVVGAGLTGSVAALALCSGGASVMVLEASTPASGATGRSGGYIVPVFSAVRPGALITARGDIGRRLVGFAARSAASTFELIREHAIECEAFQGGWFNPAPSPTEVERLAADVSIWRDAGVELEILDALETKLRTGAAGYAGASFAPSGGTIHPVKLVYGLLERALSRGARLHTGTPVVSVAKSGQEWLLATTRGTVRAKCVLLCTNANSGPLSNLVDRSVVHLLICQMATQPIDSGIRAHLFGQGSALSDLRHNLFTYRFDRDWRLVTGTMPLLPQHSGATVSKRMARRLHRILGLSIVPNVDYTWFGKASVTEDRLPAIFNVADGLYAITACNGRGLALSANTALLLGRALLNGTLSHLPVPVREPKPLAYRRMQSVGGRLYGAVGSVRDLLQQYR
jgi:glycine/D-amino acid oxidase-like deaminating enzyme